mgnify:CR=1 FL=1
MIIDAKVMNIGEYSKLLITQLRIIILYFYHGNKWWITALSIISASFYALLLFELFSFFMIFSAAYVIWLVISVPSAFIGSYIADRIEKDSVDEDDEA